MAVSRRHWFRDNFGWIAEDFRRLIVQLGRPETWIFLAIATVFGLIGYYAFHLALRIDFMMKLRNLSEAACRDIENGPTAVLFFGTTFFFLTAGMVFGEFARHVDYKRRNARVQARSAAWQCAGWGFAAVVIGVGMMFLLESQCF